MKKYTFVRKDGIEEQEILVYLKNLMEDNDNYRADCLALQAKIEGLEKKLAEAQELDKVRIQEIDKWHGLAEQADVDIAMWKAKCLEAEGNVSYMEEKKNKQIMKLEKEKIRIEKWGDNWRSRFEATQEELKRTSMLLAVTMEQMNEGKESSETVSNSSSNNVEYKKKVESMEKKIQTLRDKLGNENVPLSILVDGLKDYAEETSIDDAHNVFNHLNNLLLSVPAWTKNVPQLKQFFREYNKKLKEPTIIAAGDYVMNKHVANEVNSVAAGAVGINIDKE